MTTTKRYERKAITGAKGWQVNAAGVVSRSRHEQTVTNSIAGLPSINLRNTYAGRIPSTGLFRYPSKVSKELCPYHRLLEEIVAYEFHGPPRDWETQRVGHLDGDDWNCHADNLRWEQLDLGDEEDELMNTIRMMRRPNRSGKGAEARRTTPTTSLQRLHFVEALNVPGMIPKKGLYEAIH
ncbi:MAG: hypothetical protein JWR34_1799 [Mycobacterium sp.]|nr:hypothetical protein [Mycobacterium sp.]